ncbi:MAG TPA: lipopolysaccharide heptosyltransferase I [Pyrinomonadaceae bacterium]|nr:lipopolysaccharide heptosyltransferase I [Pyrinomonadaceae bacterium]
MNILIVKLGAIGDVIHTLPALAAMRRAMPEAKISWAVEKRSAEILRGNTMIDDLIEVDTRKIRSENIIGKVPEIGRQLRELKKNGFDVAIDFQGLLKSATIAKLSGAKHRWGFSREDLREPASRVFLTNSVRVPERTHVISKNLLLAGEAFEASYSSENLEFLISTVEAHRDEAELIIKQAGGSFAILNPAGGWVTKLWPAERFGRLADRIWEEHRLVPLIATGPKESDLSNAVMGASRSGKALAIQPSLKGFFELAKRAAIYVGGDTGPTHLAVAAKTPIVGIFGPTEWWRNGSPDREDICVERTDIGCRVDCHRRKCSNWICMDISAETVLNAVNQRLTAQ